MTQYVSWSLAVILAAFASDKEMSTQASADAEIVENHSCQQLVPYVLDLQRNLWLPVQTTGALPHSISQTCQFSQTETGLDLIAYYLSDAINCSDPVGPPDVLPSVERFSVQRVSLVDHTINLLWHPTYPPTSIADGQSCRNDSVRQYGTRCLCHTLNSISGNSSAGLTVLAVYAGQDNATAVRDGGQTVQHPAPRQWQLPLLMHFASAVTGGGDLFIDGGVTCVAGTFRSDCFSTPSSGSYLIGLDSLWVKVLRGGAGGYEWLQQRAWPDGAPNPTMPSPMQSSLELVPRPMSTLLLLEHECQGDCPQHQRYDH